MIRLIPLFLAFLLPSFSLRGNDAAPSAPNPPEFPASFDSVAAAEKWAKTRFAGGRVDEVALMTGKHLVVFLHGSGIPVIRIALYRHASSNWTLLSTHRPPQGSAEFLRASAPADAIILTGQKTSRTWPLPSSE